MQQHRIEAHRKYGYEFFASLKNISNQYDMITAIEVIEHLRKPWNESDYTNPHIHHLFQRIEKNQNQSRKKYPHEGRIQSRRII